MWISGRKTYEYEKDQVNFSTDVGDDSRFAAFIFSEKSTFATIDSGDMSKTLFEQLKSEVAGVSDGAVIDLPAGEYVFTEEINISGKKISFRNNG